MRVPEPAATIIAEQKCSSGRGTPPAARTAFANFSVFVFILLICRAYGGFLFYFFFIRFIVFCRSNSSRYLISHILCCFRFVAFLRFLLSVRSTCRSLPFECLHCRSYEAFSRILYELYHIFIPCTSKRQIFIGIHIKFCVTCAVELRFLRKEVHMQRFLW